MIGMAHCQMAGQFIGDSDIDNGYDHYWNDVVVLCNFRTDVGSNVFYDEKSQTNFNVSTSSHVPVITASNGAGNYKSGYFNGSTSESITIHRGTWCTNTTPLTIEFFFQPVEYPTDRFENKYALMGVFGGDKFQDQLIGYTSTGQFFYGSWALTIVSTNSFPPNHTYYVKVTFDGSMVRLYVNDVLEASGSVSTFWLHGDRQICLGWSYISGYAYSYESKGYFDNFRITKAVRPSGFGVVPTKSFPTK